MQSAPVNYDLIGILMILGMAAGIGVLWLWWLRARDEVPDGPGFFAWLLGFAALAGLVWGFGQVGVPRIWTDTDDRICQAQGYWYARAMPEGQVCEKWFVSMLPGGRRR